MKTIIFFPVLLLSILPVFSGNNRPEVVREEICSKIDNIRFTDCGVNQTDVTVWFKINPENKVIVSKITGGNKALKEKLFNELNGASLKMNAAGDTALYTISIHYKKL